MIRRALAILATCVIGLTSPAASADTLGMDSSKPCDAASAQKATVHEIATSDDTDIGRCVRISAVMHGRYLYGGLDGLYGPRKDSIDLSSTGNAIGLDFLAVKRNLQPGYFNVVVTGRIGDCERSREIVRSLNPTGIVMIGGYCHSFNGRYLQVVGLKARSKSDWERQLRSDQHPDFGDLVAAPSDWPY